MPDSANRLKTLEKIEIKSFDYKSFDIETRLFLERKTTAIKLIYTRTLQDAFELGSILLEVKEKLDYGQFCRWITLELGLSRSTACNQMHLAANLSCATVAQLKLPITICYELARTSTPSTARDEVISRIRSGKKITSALTRQIIADHRSKAKERGGPSVTRNNLLGQDQPVVTIDVQCEEINDLVHFRSRSRNHTKPITTNSTFNAISLFSVLNSHSLEILQFILSGDRGS